jgi:integrase
LKPGESFKHYFGVLQAILDYAGVEPNPARDRRVRLPRGEQEEVNPPTGKQFLAILDNTVGHLKRLAFMVMERTAMEPGTLCKLTWGDVDVAESQFRLQRKNVKGGRSVRARWVQVPRWLMDAIEDTCPFEDRIADRKVFGGSPGALRKSMERACQKAGIAQFSPYNLRHRRISIWHHDGIPVRELAARAGHSKPTMTLDVYSHVLMDWTEATDKELLARLAD